MGLGDTLEMGGFRVTLEMGGFRGTLEMVRFEGTLNMGVLEVPWKWVILRGGLEMSDCTGYPGNGWFYGYSGNEWF